MKFFGKVVVCIAMLTLFPALPMLAQIDNGMNFTTSFPFYVGNVKMPAGSYRITQTDIDVNELLIESDDSKYSAFVDFVPTQSGEPHAQSDVTFHKYGDTEYLNRIWVEGQNYGMKVEPTKAEKKAAASAGAVEHTVSGKKR
jgi:hypothetical protein